MYFNFEEDRPDTPTIARPLSPREGVLVSIILHLLAVIVILLGPTLPFVRAAEERRQQILEEQAQRKIAEQRENPRFVFVQPRLDTPAPAPPRRAELSDIDRQARTVERAPNPTNPLPFARGNSPERIEADPAPRVAPAPPAGSSAPEPGPRPAEPDPGRQGLSLPDALTGAEPRASETARPSDSRGPAVGVIADAIRNVQRYAENEGYGNLEGGADQNFAPFIQFDTKGVEFGPWLRRFVAQIRRNWFIPMAAMSLRGHTVITFNVHKDGRITDVLVLKPSAVDAFTRAAQNAILTSNPTIPLPPEYPDDRAFFTVTFYYNESPYGR